MTVVRVFVAGGTGVIGRRLVPQLLARGHQVTATTSAAKLGLLQQLGVRTTARAAQPRNHIHGGSHLPRCHRRRLDPR